MCTCDVPCARASARRCRCSVSTCTSHVHVPIADALHVHVSTSSRNRTPAATATRTTVRAPFSPTAFGRMKIQFCQAVRRPKIFVSIVSGPANRRLASIPVSASGDSAARASIASRTSSSQSSSSGANDTSPASSAAAGSNGSVSSSSSATSSGVARKRVSQPRQAVAHPQRAAVHRRQRDGVRPIRVVEHVGPIRGERQLEQRAGKTAARLDQREEAARGQIHALQRPLDEVHDLAHQPVVLMLQQHRVDREHVGGDVPRS